MKQPLTHHLVNSQERATSSIAVRFKRHKTWLELNWKDYYRSCEAAGLALAALGVQRGDRVAILANTRWEWSALDHGILGLGAVTVPIYQSHRPEEVEFVLQNSKARVLVLENAAQKRKWEAISKRCSSVEYVVAIDPLEDKPTEVLSWEEFLNRGIREFSNRPGYFQEQALATRLDDTATILYTSGTTGEPKGVVLTHRQILSEVEDLVRAFPISPMDSTLSFLPYAHVLGRVEHWLHMYLGFTLNFAESIDRLRQNLLETKPTVLIGVPRIFEKIYVGLLTQIESHRWKKTAFHALRGGAWWPQKLLADRLIYSRLRQALGGRIRFVVSGGAPLEPQLGEFFQQAGILILEGYGLTETTAAVTVNTPERFRFGTVGRPLPDVQIKLAEDGEILVKSDKVAKGYYHDDQATLAAFQNGFFQTGDVGEWTEDGFLRITDRKKDLIKTAGGKYVAPQKLENLLKMDPLIANVLIHGDQKKYVVALVTLNEPYVKKVAQDNGWSFRDSKSLTQLPQVRDLVKRSIAQVNAQLASFESIKNFAVLAEDFTLEKGELTPSLKIKRRVCDEKYKSVLEALY